MQKLISVRQKPEVILRILATSHLRKMPLRWCKLQTGSRNIAVWNRTGNRREWVMKTYDDKKSECDRELHVLPPHWASEIRTRFLETYRLKNIKMFSRYAPSSNMQCGPHLKTLYVFNWLKRTLDALATIWRQVDFKMYSNVQNIMAELWCSFLICSYYMTRK